MSNTPVFPHRDFLNQNQANVKIEQLPPLLQRRIAGFDELENDLQYTVEDDHKKLLDLLEDLSHEIYEDLEEHLEHLIENNESDEPDQIPMDEHRTPQITPDPLVAVPATPPVTPDALPQQPLEVPVHPQAPPQLTGDEAVLQALYSSGTFRVHPDDLRRQGYKGSLSERYFQVGSYALYRGKYDLVFTISKF